jgi:ADP-ribose pyrophosphatase YjhB (NUDIX family)
MQERDVVCALVVDAERRVLLVKNTKWGGEFALPSTTVDPDREAMAPAALAAVREDLGHPLPNATITPLGYLGTAGLSGRTGQPTLYRYWAFHVDPGQPLALPDGHARFQSAADIAAATDVTWSAKDIVDAIYSGQEVAVAVISRPGRTQTEYLLLWNDNYEGYFFPAGRITAEFPAESVARAVLRGELGYTGPVTVSERIEVPDFHFSPRWGHARLYKFHVVAVSFPPGRDGEVMDLHRPLGPMERRLMDAEAHRIMPTPDAPDGWSWRWFTSAELLTPPAGVKLTPTAKAVVPAVLAAVPPKVRPLRHSDGAVALIRGTDRYGHSGWLAQWNEGWGAFFLIGGHREEGESFRDCLAREVREELDVKPGEADGFEVGAESPPLDFVAWSRRAGEYTEYAMRAFVVTLAAERLAAVNAAEKSLHLHWLRPEEVREHETTDGRRVSETVEVILTLAGELEQRSI